MTIRLRAAVIGCGRMGADAGSRLEGQIPCGWLPLSHAEALLRTGMVDLVALCDTDEGRLRAAGERYEIQRLFVDYRELLDNVRPDIVTIATRTPPKADIVEYACSRWALGVYVEKPLANTLAKCHAALRAARQSGASLFYGVNRRYHATYRRARDLVLNGEIGEVRVVTVEHGQAQLLWVHPHSVDLLIEFAGTANVVDVQATLVDGSVQLGSVERIDSDPIVEHATFRFANGVTGVISSAAGWNLRVSGTGGNLMVHADGSFIQVDRSSNGRSNYFLDQRLIHATSSAGATVTALSELVASIQRPESQLERIETGMRMLLGCAWSSVNGGGRARLADIPEQFEITGRSGHLYA